MSQTNISPLTGFLHKLEQRCPLGKADRDALFDLPCTVRSLRRHEYLVREKQVPLSCCVLVSGFAIRHKVTRKGARQIFSIHLAGEGIDLPNSLLGKADHNLQMLSAGEAAFVPVNAIREIILERPAIGQALLYDTLVEGAIFREWTLNLGRRDAMSRMAHLLCEFAVRLDAAGVGRQQGYDLPMTQEEMADSLGLTTIHVNRTLKALAHDGFIRRTARSVTIMDWPRLAVLGDFDSGYLHLDTNSAATDDASDGPRRGFAPAAINGHGGSPATV